MTDWITPVFDRTQDDIDFAIRQINQWKKDFADGKSVITYDLKGCFNLSDINRIENNIKYLDDTLTQLHYTVGVRSKVWSNYELPTVDDIKRILGNIKVIVEAYYTPNGLESLPTTLTYYTEANTIEKYLYEIKNILDRMIESFPKSGTLQAGGLRTLPLRR